MKFRYDNLQLDELGEVTVAQKFDFEGGDAPQRAKVTLTVTLEMFDRDYAANRSLVDQARAALRKQNALAIWTNEVTEENYLNQTVTNLSHDLPDDWGEYAQTLQLVFTYYEHNLNPQNLPLVFQRAGASAALTLSHITRMEESGTTERFSSVRSARKETQGKLNFTGMVLADPTRTLAQRREDLRAALVAYRDQMNGKDGVLQFGTAPNYVVNRPVRIENFTAEYDQGVNQLNYAFSASYTLFPDEANYVQVEFTADEKDDQSGELRLTLTGKIRATTEAAARDKANAVREAMLTQYGYGASQQVQWDTASQQVDAGPDGTAFLELSFSGTFRRWRDTNQQLTFKKQGSTGQPIGFGHVPNFTKSYTAKRFNEHRSQRQHAGGMVEASGTWAGDRALPIGERRAQLLAMQATMYAEVNQADGQLVYGTTFDKVVRVDNLKAEINQAETGIDWSFTATWSEFPNEANYATAEFTVNQRDNVEDGDDLLAFAGRIQAPNGAAARAKLGTLRASVLALYGYQNRQRLRGETQVNGIDANGDKTTGISEGLETATTDGVSFVELTFTEEYRKRAANLISHTLQVTSRDDTTTGLVQTTYAGTVIYGGADADAAYALARTKAESLGRNKEAAVGGQAFLKSAQLVWEQRQTRDDNNVEFVRLNFSFEYQSKLASGRKYLEVNVQVVRDTFGVDVENVSGFCVAVDNVTAEDFYLSEVRGLYAARLIRNESTGSTTVTAEKSGVFTDQDQRFEFSLQVFRPKTSGQIAYKYSITVRRDLLTGEKQSHLRGSVFATNTDAAETALNAFLLTLALGSAVTDERTHDHEHTSELAGDEDYPGLFGRLDFNVSYTDKLTGEAGLYEMRLSVETQYSGTRWNLQPIPYSADPPSNWNPHAPPDNIGGITIVQPGGVEAGGRVVRGMVSASTKALAEAWAKTHRTLLTGDAAGGNYRQPEKWDWDYDIVPRTQGLITGTNPDVKLYRLSFTFSEILPKYPPPA